MNNVGMKRKNRIEHSETIKIEVHWLYIWIGAVEDLVFLQQAVQFNASTWIKQCNLKYNELAVW